MRTFEFSTSLSPISPIGSKGKQRLFDYLQERWLNLDPNLELDEGFFKKSLALFYELYKGKRSLGVFGPKDRLAKRRLLLNALFLSQASMELGNQLLIIPSLKAQGFEFLQDQLIIDETTEGVTTHVFEENLHFIEWAHLRTLSEDELHALILKFDIVLWDLPDHSDLRGRRRTVEALFSQLDGLYHVSSQAPSSSRQGHRIWGPIPVVELKL